MCLSVCLIHNSANSSKFHLVLLFRMTREGKNLSRCGLGKEYLDEKSDSVSASLDD